MHWQLPETPPCAGFFVFGVRVAQTGWHYKKSSDCSVANSALAPKIQSELELNYLRLASVKTIVLRRLTPALSVGGIDFHECLGLCWLRETKLFIKPARVATYQQKAAHLPYGGMRHDGIHKLAAEPLPSIIAENERIHQVGEGSVISHRARAGCLLLLHEQAEAKQLVDTRAD